MILRNDWTLANILYLMMELSDGEDETTEISDPT